MAKLLLVVSDQIGQTDLNQVLAQKLVLALLICGMLLAVAKTAAPFRRKVD